MQFEPEYCCTVKGLSTRTVLINIVRLVFFITFWWRWDGKSTSVRDVDFIYDLPHSLHPVLSLSALTPNV